MAGETANKENREGGGGGRGGGGGGDTLGDRLRGQTLVQKHSGGSCVSGEVTPATRLTARNAVSAGGLRRQAFPFQLVTR